MINNRNIIFLACFFFFLILNFASAQESCDVNLDGKNTQQLEELLKKCEADIAEQEKKLQSKQKESVTIERDIVILKSKIDKTQSDIRAKEIVLTKLKSDINSKKNTLQELSQKTVRILSYISSLVKKTNELDSFSTLEAILSQESLSEFFVDFDNFNVLKSDLSDNLIVIGEIKKETQSAKEILEENESRERAVKLAKEAEKRKTEIYKQENQKLLSLNRAKENEYKKDIAEKEKIKLAIKNRIFRTVGGTELKFGEALKLILPYQEIVGVEPALVLAILTQESAIDGVIGSNLGRCVYNQPAKNSSGTVMSNSQKDSFLAIMKELGMNADTTPVSCPIYSDGAYGGAMGPSQFMPNTWWDVVAEVGYKKRVGKVLGIKTPSPFVNLDAFIGTALYLSDARSLCSGSGGFSKQSDIWSCSAAKYYAGLGASGSRLSKHMTSKWSYGYRVAERAAAFQKDIDTLDL